eukprot:309229-Pelagomonas_calceolata.AAC.4
MGHLTVLEGQHVMGHLTVLEGQPCEGAMHAHPVEAQLCCRTAMKDGELAQFDESASAARV